MSLIRNHRKYGEPPYNIFLVHGGPGAIGDMRPVCEYISPQIGVIETFHKGLTISAQLDELLKVINENTDVKATLIGHSWGAWLAYIFAAKYPDMVSKLILIGCPPFEAPLAEDIMGIRFQRLSESERRRMVGITSKLDSPLSPPSSSMLHELRDLLIKADSFELLDYYKEYCVQMSYEIYRNVWYPAEKMRKDGSLLELAENIACPVWAIHGDYDPHPSKGVEMPLSDILYNFQFVEFKKCGHYPWFEKHAQKLFYDTLLKIIL